MESNSKNFLKKTNSSQFQKLVELMEHYPQLATGSPTFGSSKVSAEATWDIIATKINALGPPIRSGLEWKRVWQDQKCRLKKKIAENNRSLHGTGGGPCTVINLTGLEQQIDRICQLSSAAAPSGTVLGLPPNVPKLQQQINNVLGKHKITPSTSEKIEQPIHQNKKRKHNENSMDRQAFLHEQITMQRKTLEIMTKQAEAAEEQARALKEIANTTNVIAKTLMELLKHLKDED